MSKTAEKKESPTNIAENSKDGFLQRRRWPYMDRKLIKKVRKIKKAGIKRAIKTWRRSATIISEWIGVDFLVHNGKKHIPVQVTEIMVGKKLGEFAPTRTFKGHGSN